MAEQTLLVSDIKRRLFIFLQRRLPDTFDQILATDLVRIANRVAKDINREAGLLQERYSETLESAITYLEVQGDILQVYFFQQKDDDWKDQRYGHITDTFVFQTAIPAETYIDIIYLRDVMEITDTDTDSVDLPGYALDTFYDLLQARFLIEFGDADSNEYEAMLQARAFELKKYRRNDLLMNIPCSWQNGNSSSRKYDITDQRVSDDLIAVDTDEIPFITQQ